MRFHRLLAGILFAPLTLALVQLPTAPAANDADLQRTGRIEGRVLPLAKSRLADEKVRGLDAAGENAVPKDVPDVKVHSVKLYVSDSGVVRGEAEVKEDGTFAFDGVPAGTVRLIPTFRVGESSNLVSPGGLDVRTVVEAGQTTHVAFFGKGRPVRGKVILPAGVKAEDVSVRLVLTAPPFHVVTRPGGKAQVGDDWRAYGMLTMDYATGLAADGEFCFDRVREGVYHFSAEAKIDGKAMRLRFDGTASAGDLHVEHGKFAVPLMADGESDKPHNLGILRFE